MYSGDWAADMVPAGTGSCQAPCVLAAAVMVVAAAVVLVEDSGGITSICRHAVMFLVVQVPAACDIPAFSGHSSGEGSPVALPQHWGQQLDAYSAAGSFSGLMLGQRDPPKCIR